MNSPDKIKILAHRGASGKAPENTLAAFELAIEEGADGFETDIRLTKDDQIVICHDEDLFRTAGQAGRVQDYTLAELSKFNFAHLFPDFPVQRILTLDELLALAKKENLFLNIEVKHSVKSFFKYRKLATAAAEAVVREGMEKQVIFSSFLHLYMLWIKRKYPELACGILYDKRKENRLNYALRLRMDALHPRQDLIFKEEVEAAQSKNVQVNLWTVNTEEELLRAIDLGVDSIITNFPARALRLVKERKL